MDTKSHEYPDMDMVASLPILPIRVIRVIRGSDGRSPRSNKHPPALCHNVDTEPDREVRTVVYFVIQMLLLFFVTLACWLKPDQLLRMPDQWLWVPLLLSFFGIIKILYGLVTLGRYLYPLPAVQPNSPLIRHGAFAKVRHPIYGGFMLLAIGASAYTGCLTAMAISFVLCIWLTLKARYEERLLLQKFPEYAEYQKNSRAFI